MGNAVNKSKGGKEAEHGLASPMKSASTHPMFEEGTIFFNPETISSPAEDIPRDLCVTSQKKDDLDHDFTGSVDETVSHKEGKCFESAKKLFYDGNKLLKQSNFLAARISYYRAINILKRLNHSKKREEEDIVASRKAEMNHTTCGLSNLAAMEFAAGRFGEAKKILQQACEYRQSIDGVQEISIPEETKEEGEKLNVCPDSLVALKIALNKDITFHRLPDSQKMMACVIEVHSSIDCITADILNNLAACNEVLGLVEPAIGMYTESLNLRKVVFGERSLKAADVMQNLATILDSSGRLQEALALLDKALEIQTEISGDKSVETAITTNNLGVVHAHIGNLNISEDYLKRSLHLREVYYGRDTQFTASARQNLTYIQNKKKSLEQHPNMMLTFVEVGNAPPQQHEKFERLKE